MGFPHSEMTVTIRKPSTSASHPHKFGSILSKLLGPFARRFIAGTSLSEALDFTANLKSQGFYTSVDHLGESVTSAEEAAIAAEQYLIILKALKERNLDKNVSLKLTQMGLEIDEGLCQKNLERIVLAAGEAGGFVRVDMEGSFVTQKTLDIVLRIKQNRATPVGTVLQAMLKRTPADLVKLLERDVTIRLCKGAYREPKEIAYQDMRDIRRQYLALAKRLITSGSYHGIATHDEHLINEIISFARSQKISPDTFEFQMLLGIKRSLQKKIVADGWCLRIYVPFGRAWLPYTWRRLRERKENVWFVVKSLFQW